MLSLAVISSARATPPPLDGPLANCNAAGFVRQAEFSEVSIRFGTLASANKGNKGGTQNSVLMTLKHGTALVDPGPSPRLARDLERELATQPGCRLKWVINTHPHPENVLGNAGFSKTVSIVSSAEVAKVMRARCPRCRARFVEQLGLTELSAIPIRLPQAIFATPTPSAKHSVAAPRSSRLQKWPDELQLFALGDAHSQADLTLFNQRSGLLLTAGVANCHVLPELAEGNIDSWIRVMATLQELPARHFLGAQGKLCDVAQLQETDRYLHQLLTLVRNDVSTMGDAASAAQRLKLPFYEAWALYAERHPLNVQRLYQALEAKSFETYDERERVRR